MTTETDLEKRVDRMEKEAVAIYDLIDARTLGLRSVQSDHTRILGEHSDALAEILRRLPEPTAS
ncbi:MAG TPA: hypothetical protein VFE15_10300 [Marmoricola sp.]|jgi:hypothetical protein|nr:hypothetical protein [Marmoricola sp.]